MGDHKYGVVDSDDGVETIVPLNVLANAVRNLKLDIKGATFTDLPNIGFGEYIGSIFPQQLQETVTQLQVKTNVLYHIDIKVYKNIITSIRWRSDEITQPVRVRLSDFGKVLGDRCLSGNRPSTRHPVTLIFDDNISLETCALWRPASLENSESLILDIRDLTNYTTVMRIYRDWAADLSGYGRAGSILDLTERKEYILHRI